MSTPGSDQLEVFFRRSLRSSAQYKRPIPYIDPRYYAYYLRRQVTLIDEVMSKNKRKSEDNDVTLEFPSLCYMLQKLKEDLQTANTKFLQEFVAEPQNGVRSVLDLLNSCWKIQIDQKLNWIRDSKRQFLLKNALREEHECLLCLKNCMTLKEAVTMVMKHSNGVSTLAFCIMSNSRKSRLLALQASFDGNEMVLEAMTSLQLAYGESVRFKFMVSMLKTETRNSADFKFAVLVLINTIILRTRDLNQKVRLQCEFKKAGLNISKLEEELFEKTMPGNDGIWKEISKWKERYLNVENIMSESQKMVSQIKVLKNEVKHLHEVNEKLETQKRSLMRAEIKKLDMTEISESYCTEIKSPHQYSVDIIECGHPDNDKILIDVPTLFSSKKNLQAVPKLPHPVTVDNSPQEKYCLSSNYAKSDNTLKVTKNIHPVPIFNYNTSLEKKPTYQFTTPSTQCFDNVNRSSVMTGVNNGSCFKTTGITGTYEYGRNAALSKCIRDSERQSIVSNSSDVRFISKRSFSLYLHSPSSCQDDINVQEELIRPVFKTSFLRDNFENKRFIKSNHH